VPNTRPEQPLCAQPPKLIEVAIRYCFGPKYASGYYQYNCQLDRQCRMSPIDPGWSTSTILLLNPITPRAPISKRILSVVDYCLASLVGIFGIAIALLTLKRGIWWDEFVLLGFSTPGTSPREFLHEMITQDTNPISYYGMVYLLRAAGITNIMVLRSINLLGLPLAIFALSYGYRHKIINLSQAVIVWMLFASSPIFYDQFANLRCYFFLYAASLATSIIWYVLMLQLDSDKRLSTTTIAIWAADLMFFAICTISPRSSAECSLQSY